MRNNSFKNASVDNSSGDSVGTNVLTITVIIGSVLLLLAALAGPAPVQADANVAQVAKPAIEQVVVIAARHGHVS
jgi:hypothetical protein